MGENTTTRYVSIVSSLLGLLLAFGICVRARADGLEAWHRFSIPAQSLDTAILAFSKQARIQVVLSEDAPYDTRSPGADGDLPTAAALEMILKNTGLVFRQFNADRIAIVRAGKVLVKATGPAFHAGQEWATPTTLAEEFSGESQTKPGAKMLPPGDRPGATQSDERTNSTDRPPLQQAAREKPAQIEEVIVTAQRRKEDLELVPVSVTVIGDRVLQQDNHNSLQELTQTLPGVHVSTARDSNNLYIRGIGSGNNALFDQSVAMFTDDIYHGRSQMSNATFLDLDRIEVLKGPQSTFFGNNAIAGALNIVSKKPEDHFEAWARALYGEFGQYVAEGAVGGPIADTFGMRLAVTRNGVSDGWIDNVTLDQRVPRINNRGARLTLSFTPASSLDVSLKVEGSQHTTAGAWLDQPLQWDRCPLPAPLPPDFNAFPGAGCPGAIALGVPIGLNQNKTTGIAGQNHSLSTFENVLTVNYRRWGHTFTSVSGYYNYHSETNGEVLELPVWLASIQNLEKYHQFSQELRVASPSDQRIEYLFGAYFQTDHLDSKADSNVPVFDFFASIPGFEGLTPYLPIAGAAGFSQGEQVYSGFGSLRWNVTDRLRVNGGLRASRINKRSNGFSLFGTGTQTYGGFAAFPPDIGDLAANLFGFGNGGQSLSRSDRALMPSAGIQYQMQPEAMLYFSFSRGFKAGGINPSGPLGPAQNNEFGPEYVNAYELGLKSKWFDDTLLLNLDVFRSDYNGLQVQAIVFNPSTNTNFPETRNAAASRSQGVELETQWAMTKDLRFSADVTYLDAHYVSYPNGPQSTLELFCAGNYMLPYCSRFPNPVPPYLDLSGSPTDYAPKWSGRITVAYSIPFPRNFKLSTELSSYFTTRYFPGTGGDEYLINVGGYARLDGRLTLETLDSRWALDLIGKNLTDRVIVSGGNDLILASKEQPRNVAVQFRYRF